MRFDKAWPARATAPIGGIAALAAALWRSAWALGALENIGTLGIGRKAGPCNVIRACVPGYKMGLEMSRGAATLVLCTRSGELNVGPRGGAVTQVNTVAHSCGACFITKMADMTPTGP